MSPRDLLEAVLVANVLSSLATMTMLAVIAVTAKRLAMPVVRRALESFRKVSGLRFEPSDCALVTELHVTDNRVILPVHVLDELDVANGSGDVLLVRGQHGYVLMRKEKGILR